MPLSTTNLHNHWTAKTGVLDSGGTYTGWEDRVSTYDLTVKSTFTVPNIGAEGIEFDDAEAVDASFGATILSGGTDDRETWFFAVMSMANNQSNFSYIWDGVAQNDNALYANGANLVFRSGGTGTTIFDSVPNNEKFLLELRVFDEGSLNGSTKTLQAWVTIQDGSTQLVYDESVEDNSIASIEAQGGVSFGVRGDGGFGDGSVFTLYERGQYVGAVAQQAQEDNREFLLSEWGIITPSSSIVQPVTITINSSS